MNEFRATVLGYLRKHGRHTLPWRKTHDPYAILVSEIMLQQTQVDRVVPYFERWMKRFPNPRVLADATLQDALREWSGLGYNRRAKFLRDAAREIVKRGSFPREYEELRTLSGVGDYTAKAVRVFAFNEPEVLIETNVRSVFIHHFFPKARSVSDARLMPLIKKALENQDPRVWYSALMDYGTHIKATHPNPSRKSKHHVRQSAFKGSIREVRGAILKARSQKQSLVSVKKKFPVLFREALSALQREGLVSGHSK